MFWFDKLFSMVPSGLCASRDKCLLAGVAAVVLSLPVTVNEQALMKAISAAQALGDMGKIPVATLVITAPWQSDRELKRLNGNCFSYLFLICDGISRVKKFIPISTLWSAQRQSCRGHIAD